MPDVDVGDIVQLDVGGQIVRARVTSIRRVAWDETQNGGFFFVLRPAPAVLAAAARVRGIPPDGRRRHPPGRVCSARSSTGFPNMSAIDVRAVVASIRDVLDNITLGITVVGAVTLVSGVLILIGAVAMTKFQRLYEAAIYRTLGRQHAADRHHGGRRIRPARRFWPDWSGAAGAFALSWALARYLFEITWRPAPGLAGRRRAADGDSRQRLSAWSPASTCSPESRWARCAVNDLIRCFGYGGARHACQHKATPGTALSQGV